MEGSPLRTAFKRLVQEVMDENQSQNITSDPEQGVVSSLNDDGTVNVQGSFGQYSGVGAAIVFTIGARVVIITADGKKTAIPS